MTLLKWPEEDLRPKFCNTTFKGLKTNPKPAKEESWRRTGGQLTERLSCCVHNYRLWRNGWHWAAVSSLKDKWLLTCAAMNLNRPSLYVKIIGKLRKLGTLWWQSSGKTQHMCLFTSNRELRTDQCNDCSKSTWWTNDFWLLLLMNMGEELLCKQKRWLKSSCIPGNLSQDDELVLELHAQPAEAQQSESLFSLQFSSDQVSPLPLLPPFDNAGEGLQRISQVSVPLDRWPLLSLLSLSHVRCSGEKRPWLMQHGKRSGCNAFQFSRNREEGCVLVQSFHNSFLKCSEEQISTHTQHLLNRSWTTTSLLALTGGALRLAWGGGIWRLYQHNCLKFLSQKEIH